MKPLFTKQVIPMLCAGLLCTPAYASGLQETESIHISDTARAAYQHMIEESIENQESESSPEIQSTHETLSTDPTSQKPSEETQSETAEDAPEEMTLPEAETKTESIPETSEDMISVVETESGVDADGFVTMDISVAENVTLPVTVTMKSKEGTFSFTVSYQEQPVKLKPGSYQLTKVVDGSNQELTNGANLTIPEENGEVYLDFTKPEEESDSLLSKFFTTNLIYLQIAAVLWLLYKRWMEYD